MGLRGEAVEGERGGRRQGKRENSIVKIVKAYDCSTILQHKQQADFKYTNKLPTLKHTTVLYKYNRKDNNPDPCIQMTLTSICLWIFNLSDNIYQARQIRIKDIRYRELYFSTMKPHCGR